MELMENSNATFGSSPYNILRFFGVSVSGAQSFVDVGNGISHLDDKEFIELLEFVKKYRCVDDGRTLKGIPCYRGFPTEEGS